MPRVNGEPVVCLTRNGDAYQNVVSSTSTIFKTYEPPYYGHGIAKFACQGQSTDSKCDGSTIDITFTAQNVEYVGHQVADYSAVKTFFPTCSDTTNLAGYNCYSFTVYEDNTLVELVAVSQYKTLLTSIGYTRSTSSGYHLSVDHGDQQYLFTQTFGAGTYEIPIHNFGSWRKYLVVRFPELSCGDINEYLIRIERAQAHHSWIAVGTSPTQAWEKLDSKAAPQYDPTFLYSVGDTVCFHKTSTNNDFLLCDADQGLVCRSDSSLVVFTLPSSQTAASPSNCHTFSASGDYEGTSASSQFRNIHVNVLPSPSPPPPPPPP